MLLKLCVKHFQSAGGRGGGSGGSGYSGRTTKIFIGGLPNDANDDNLKSCFSRFGQVSGEFLILPIILNYYCF